MLSAPTLAMIVVGAALFGPGRASPFEAARIFGGPTEGLTRMWWRIALTRRYREIDSVVADANVVVRATAGGEHAAGRCTTGADGVCDVEVRLQAPARGPIDVVVVRASDDRPDAATNVEIAPLARGAVMGNVARWSERPARAPELKGVRSGDLEIRLYAVRGVMAAPFPDDIALSVTRDGEPRAHARVEMQLIGGDVAATPDAAANGGATSLVVTTGDDGRAKLTAIPRAHAVEVTAHATWGSATGEFASTLPVVPGALWLDPQSRSSGALRVVSPVPRACAYATLDTRTARLWGGTVYLQNDDHGFAAGSVPWPDVALPPSEPIWLTLASDPEATGVGTVGWPIAPASDAPAAEQSFADSLLLDGLPAAEERETRRRRRAAWLVVSALGAAAGLEGVLLWSTARARGTGGWARLALAVAAVVLAFAAIGIVAMWKAAG
jgi:hypothetical protein